MTYIAPMLAGRLEAGTDLKTALTNLSGGGNVAEVKLDGHRAIARIENGKVVSLRSRPSRALPEGSEISHRFPEVVANLQSHLPGFTGTLDGEIGPLDPSGLKMDISILQHRPRSDPFGIKVHAAKFPMAFVAFDILDAPNSGSTLHMSYEQRRALLEQYVFDSEFVRTTTVSTDVWALYDLVTSAGGEGIIVKSRNGSYRPGKRGPEWLKVKAPDYHDNLHVVGILQGEGKRAWAFGALVLARNTIKGMEYVCKAGTGLSDHDLQRVLDTVKQNNLTRPTSPLFQTPYLDAPVKAWLHPGLTCDVKYQQPTAKSPRFPSVVSLAYKGVPL